MTYHVDGNITASGVATVSGNFTHSLTVSGIPVVLGLGDSGVTVHDQLSGLLDDDHTQYIRVDGTRAFTGSQSLGNNNLTSVATISATTVTGTTGQFGGNLSAQAGAFNRLTVSGIPVDIAAGNLNNVVEDLTPQLGGHLDVNGKIIGSAGNGIVTIRPSGTGDIRLFTGKMSDNSAASNAVWIATSGTVADIYLDTISEAGGDIYLQSHGAVFVQAEDNSGSIALDTTATVTVPGRIRLTSSADEIQLQAGIEIDCNAPIRGEIESASSPTFSFKNDSNTGMFRQGTDILGFAAGGDLRLTVSGASVNPGTYGAGIDGNLTVTGTVGAKRGEFETGLTVSGAPVNTGATDHGNLSGLSDDDHTQYSLVAGTRAFTGTVAGVTPTSSAHLTTKAYVDGKSTAIVGDAFINVTSGTNTINIGADAIISNSANLVVTTGTSSITLAPSATPSYTSVTATTVTGTTGQFAGAVSAQSGSYSNSLTVSGTAVNIGFPVLRIQFPMVGTANNLWSNMPLAQAFLLGNAGNQVQVDTRPYTQCRLIHTMESGGTVATAKGRLGYYTNFTATPGLFLDVGNGESPEVTFSGSSYIEVSPWVTLKSAAKFESCVLAVIGSGGDGGADPRIGHMTLELTP